MKVTGKARQRALMLACASLVAVGTSAGAAPAAWGAGHQGREGHQTHLARQAADATAQALLRRGSLVRGSSREARAFAALPAGARRVPMPGLSSELEGVWCTAFTNCWGVGFYHASNGAQLNEALHWNGSTWSRVSTPNPGGTGSHALNELIGARCTKPTDCWAVGDSQKNGHADLDQALHWNGKKWSLVPTPAPGGTGSADSNSLFDVVCASSSNCWAVGDYGVFATSEQLLNQALHWDGKKWSQVHTPNPGGNGTGLVQAMEGVRCTAAKNCWAVGIYGDVNSGSVSLLNMALRWDGKKWSLAKTPNPAGTSNNEINGLVGLSCTSASNCWGVGDYGPLGTDLNEALHWNGKKWSQATTPNPDGTGTGANNALISVSCTKSSNCWAVGEYGSISAGVGTVLNEALRWNGTKWSLAKTPNPAGTSDGDSNMLNSVRCTSTSRCWAVGDSQRGTGAEVNQALRWNGTKWSTG